MSLYSTTLTGMSLRLRLSIGMIGIIDCPKECICGNFIPFLQENLVCSLKYRESFAIYINYTSLDYEACSSMTENLGKRHVSFNPSINEQIQMVENDLFNCLYTICSLRSFYQKQKNLICTGYPSTIPG